MIQPPAEPTEPLFEHQAAYIKAIRKIIDRIRLAVMGERGHDREDVVIPYPILVTVLIIAAKDIFAIFCEADHPMQDKLIGFAAHIKRDVILFQPVGLLRKGHLIMLAVEHREHAVAGRRKDELLTSVKALLHHRDEFGGRYQLTQ